MQNRLSQELSPYLKQHETNPIHWFPWGNEAFDKAQKEDKPVFLSVGYSTCHWCHVMAHESFEDKIVAQYLNEHFVCIKLDREERPDIDDFYMLAVQIATGNGGWPMTLFLNQEKMPFFAGTYFPKVDKKGYPSFYKLIQTVNELWQTNRDEVDKTAAKFKEHIGNALNPKIPKYISEFNLDKVEKSIKELENHFDQTHGGFGEKPKFPSHTAIQFLIRYLESELAYEILAKQAKHMLHKTLSHMAMGAIHDHVGGGFHRYSTDEKWGLPHFEKMLYDNAQMLFYYSKALEKLDLPDDERELYEKACNGILLWLKENMITSDGVFASAMDADSGGEEGSYYVWAADEIREIFGNDAWKVMQTFNIQGDGNYLDESTKRKTGNNILYLTEIKQQVEQETLDKLRKKRDERDLPHIDYKGILSWNGLMIESLCLVDERQLASSCADKWLKAEEDSGYLPHQLTQGKVQGKAFLEDYAHFILGLRKLGGDYKKHAERLTAKMVELFHDEESGGFFSVAKGEEILVARSKSLMDRAEPSSHAAALECMSRAGDFEKVYEGLQVATQWMEQAPLAMMSHFRIALELIESQQTISWPKLDISIQNDELKIEIPDGYHIRADEGLIIFAEEGEIDLPKSMNGIYKGTLTISVEPKKKVTVRYQLCSETGCQKIQEITLG